MMSDTIALPASLAVRNLFEDLLGREVTVNPGDPAASKDVPNCVVAIYTDNSGTRLAAVVGIELSLAAYAGAALGLMPAGAAEDSIETKQLAPMLAENVGELFNVFTTLLNREGAPHVKLNKVVLPGEDVPQDAAAYLVALGKRLDLKVEVARYGGGKFFLSLVA